MDYVLAAAESLMEDSHSAAIQKRATIARPTNLPDSRTECGPGRPGQSAPPPGQACGILLNGGVVLQGLAPDGPACPPNANPCFPSSLLAPNPEGHTPFLATSLSPIVLPPVDGVSVLFLFFLQVHCYGTNSLTGFS